MIKETVRNLRKNSTESELIFWNVVRNRKLCGKKFCRQHPIKFEIEGKPRFFIADFYNAEQKIVIEIDGSIHMLQKDYDELRTYIMNSMGIKVIRFSNENIKKNLDNVLIKLKEELISKSGLDK
ncbi:endonuclease domain-containing protein [Candidatus Latescibacterota bacterium]